MPDYIPSADGSFDAWQANFVTYATANAAALGLDPLVDIPPLAAAQPCRSGPRPDAHAPGIVGSRTRPTATSSSTTLCALRVLCGLMYSS